MQRQLRRLRRYSRAHPRRTALAGVGALLLLAALWAALSVLLAVRQLSDVEDQAEIMRAAVIRGDADGARRALDAYQDAADGAADRTSGPTWSVLGRLPVLGDDVRGVATVADVLAEIGHDGLEPVVDATDQLTADSFQPVDGVFPVDRIRAMEEPARQSEAAFDEAAATLAGVDSSGFAGPLGRRFTGLRDLVVTARDTLDSTYRASRLMPTLLGEEQPRYFLMVLQNNAEMRSSGGLPGALSLVRAQAGKVDIVAQSDMSDIGEATADVELELTPDEERLFGRNFGRVAVNATLTPDFPRAAALIRARWERATGRPIDGMVFVDPVAVSYLLQGVGQVAVPGHPPVNHLTVVQAVENEVYLRTPDRDLQSDYQQAVAKAVFDSFAAGAGDSVTAIQGLVTAVAEGRIRAHFFEPDDQAEIAGTQIAGEFPTSPTAEPRVGIYLNDGGPTKMQYYLTYDAELFARACDGDDAQEVAGSIEITNTAQGRLPPSVTGEGYPGVRVEPGEQLLVIYVTSPVEGRVQSVSLGGQVIRTPAIQDFANRQVAIFGVKLAPQESETIDFVMVSGPGQAGDPELEVTPGAFPGSASTTARSSCRVR